MRLIAFIIVSLFTLTLGKAQVTETNVYNYLKKRNAADSTISVTIMVDTMTVKVVEAVYDADSTITRISFSQPISKTSYLEDSYEFFNQMDAEIDEYIKMIRRLRRQKALRQRTINLLTQ